MPPALALITRRFFSLGCYWFSYNTSMWQLFPRTSLTDIILSSKLTCSELFSLRTMHRIHYMHRYALTEGASSSHLHNYTAHLQWGTYM
jgi:hypothetical protein